MESFGASSSATQPNQSQQSLTADEYKKLYKALADKVRYYAKLESSKGQLTANQQSKYTKLREEIDKIKSLRPESMKKKKYNTYEEYLEANKEHAKQRYQRVKDTPEHKRYQKEYYQSHYVHKRPTKTKSADSSPSEYSSDSPLNSDEEFNIDASRP